MSLGIGVLFGVILFLVIVLCLPIQFQFDSTYQKEWSAVCSGSVLFVYTVSI